MKGSGTILDVSFYPQKFPKDQSATIIFGTTITDIWGILQFGTNFLLKILANDIAVTTSTTLTMTATPWTKTNKFTITPLNTAVGNSLGWRFETLLSMFQDFTHNRRTRSIQRYCNLLKIFLLPKQLLNTMPLCFG